MLVLCVSRGLREDGTNSDILSAETAAAMQDRHVGLDILTVADQGHAPLLADPHTVGRIASFIANCDA